MLGLNLGTVPIHPAVDYRFHLQCGTKEATLFIMLYWLWSYAALTSTKMEWEGALNLPSLIGGITELLSTPLLF